MVYSTIRFLLCLGLCYFVLVFFSPCDYLALRLPCIVITSLGEERAHLSAFRTFVRFALVWFCLFPLLLRVWEGLRLVIVARPGLFSYLFCFVASGRLYFVIVIFPLPSSLSPLFCLNSVCDYTCFTVLFNRWSEGSLFWPNMCLQLGASSESRMRYRANKTGLSSQ